MAWPPCLSHGTVPSPRLCNAVHVQEHERKHGKEQRSMMQSVWGLVTGAASKQQAGSSAAAEAATAAKAKPQVAVITASGQQLAHGTTHLVPASSCAS